MRVERFTAVAGAPAFEGAVERFRAVHERALAEEPLARGAPRHDEREVLLHAERAGLEHVCLLAGEQGAEVGRALAALAPGFVVGGEAAGVIGLWRVDHAAHGVAEALLEESFAFLRARGARIAVGPIDLSTWYGHRFVTEGAGDGPFLLEPVCHRDDAASWLRAGFAPFAEHATLRVPHVPVRLLGVSYRRASSSGVRFVPFEECERAAALSSLYALAAKSFAGKAAYRAIEREEFLRLYDGMDALLVPGLSYLARDERGALLGFLFAYPDLLETQRTGARPTTTVVKTIAIAREAPPFLGWALMHRHVEAARAMGFTHGLYALMEKWRPLYRYVSDEQRMLGGELATIHKRYALFTRPL